MVDVRYNQIEDSRHAGTYLKLRPSLSQQTCKACMRMCGFMHKLLSQIGKPHKQTSSGNFILLIGILGWVVSLQCLAFCVEYSEPLPVSKSCGKLT